MCKIIGLELRDFRHTEHSACFIVWELAQHIKNSVFPVAEKLPFRRKLPPDGNGRLRLHAKPGKRQRRASALAQSGSRTMRLKKRPDPCPRLLLRLLGEHDPQTIFTAQRIGMPVGVLYGLLKRRKCAFPRIRHQAKKGDPFSLQPFRNICFHGVSLQKPSQKAGRSIAAGAEGCGVLPDGERGDLPEHIKRIGRKLPRREKAQPQLTVNRCFRFTDSIRFPPAAFGLLDQKPPGIIHTHELAAKKLLALGKERFERQIFEKQRADLLVQCVIHIHAAPFRRGRQVYKCSKRPPAFLQPVRNAKT